jgi:hypothetical protein
MIRDPQVANGIKGPTGPTGPTGPAGPLNTGAVFGLSQTNTANANISINGSTWILLQSKSVTPSSTSDGVLLVADFVAMMDGPLNSSAYFEFELRRGSTSIYTKNMQLTLFDSTFTEVEALGHSVPYTMTYIDSPATTSVTTYSLYGRAQYRTSGQEMYVSGNINLQSAVVKG